MSKLDWLYCTCGACPTQYEGTTPDGRDVYFRYRSGRWRVDIDGEQAAAGSTGDGLDGVMDHDHVIRLVSKALSQSTLDKE